MPSEGTKGSRRALSADGLDLDSVSGMLPLNQISYDRNDEYIELTWCLEARGSVEAKRPNLTRRGIGIGRMPSPDHSRPGRKRTGRRLHSTLADLSAFLETCANIRGASSRPSILSVSYTSCLGTSTDVPDLAFTPDYQFCRQSHT